MRGKYLVHTEGTVRNLLAMDTIQIEITNYCIHECSNCTRFCGHHRRPYHMDFDTFKQAVDSLADYPQMTGIMGGEPLLHPEFERFCDYALSKIPKDRLGLWSCFPEGFEDYRTTIANTFDHIFLNDHTRDDIYHAPILVAIQEIIPSKTDMHLIIDHCWLQNSWSAAINPKGAFFCEIAAAMSILFDGPGGWPVEKGWWKKVPKDFASQVEEWCPKCGCALNLPRRKSTEEIDDISPGNLALLKDKSRKIAAGKFKISDLRIVDDKSNPPMAAYKDAQYRDRIAARYGMILAVNQRGFLTPYLKNNKEIGGRSKSLFEEYKEKAGILA